MIPIEVELPLSVVLNGLPRGAADPPGVLQQAGDDDELAFLSYYHPLVKLEQQLVYGKGPPLRLL